LDLLRSFDPEAEVNRLANRLRADLSTPLHRRGAVVGVSGGVDSAVVLALCVRALGASRVLAVLLPERESSPESAALASAWAEQLGVEVVLEDITQALEGAGGYARRDSAIRRVFPEYGEGWRSKITLPGGLLDEETLNVFSLTVVDPSGIEHRQRIPPSAFSQIVAASNFKQRLRMAMLYYHAERLNFAVVGTANKDEHDLGFFVKHGDAGVDLAPIQHLFKVQVYRLAEVLGVPAIIRERTPTSDTYSAGSTQEEFFFRLPFDVLDGVWAAWEEGIPGLEIAGRTGLTEEQVERVVKDLLGKQRTTEYLRLAPLVYPPVGSPDRLGTDGSTA